jgi:hypothetical protein
LNRLQQILEFCKSLLLLCICKCFTGGNHPWGLELASLQTRKCIRQSTKCEPTHLHRECVSPGCCLQTQTVEGTTLQKPGRLEGDNQFDEGVHYNCSS